MPARGSTRSSGGTLDGYSASLQQPNHYMVARHLRRQVTRADAGSDDAFERRLMAHSVFTHTLAVTLPFNGWDRGQFSRKTGRDSPPATLPTHATTVPPHPMPTHGYLAHYAIAQAGVPNMNHRLHTGLPLPTRTLYVAGVAFFATMPLRTRCLLPTAARYCCAWRCLRIAHRLPQRAVPRNATRYRHAAPHYRAATPYFTYRLLRHGYSRVAALVNEPTT